MQLQPDIQQKLEQDFNKDFPFARDEIEALYDATNCRIPNKMVRSIIYLAQGDLALLKDKIQSVQTDYKDVLWQAEYDRGDDQLRDFDRTFLELGLLK